MYWDAITAVATSILAVGVVTGFLQVRNASRDERYFQYVSRYVEILTHLPYGIFDFDTNKNLTPSEKQYRWLEAYVDLCAEEIFDYERGTIGGEVWKNWQQSIKKSFANSTLLKGVLAKFPDDSYTDLFDFVEHNKAPKRLSLWKRIKANLDWPDSSGSDDDK